MIEKNETPNAPNAGGNNNLENLVGSQSSTDGAGCQPSPKQIEISKMRRTALRLELEAAKLRAQANYDADISAANLAYLRGLADAQRS